MKTRRVVTSRRGGVSVGAYDSFNLGGRVGDEPAAVRANQARLAGELGLAEDRLVWMEQIHGAAVHSAVPSDGGAGSVETVDGLVTAEPGLALVVLAADCVPILLADEEAGVVGAAHAGRPGAAAGIGANVLTAMTGLGADPARVDVLLGPAICGACYEVPAGMRDAVDARLPGSACTTRQGTPGLDLRAGLARQLTEAGVRRVVSDPRCTAEDRDLYSYRRDGVTGRHAGLVWIEP